MPTSADLVVLGAGPAALTAAWRAAAAGRSVVVLERAAAPGGMAASVEVAGVRVDHGSHRLHPSTAPHLLDALRDLLANDLQTRRRNGRLHLYGRWVGFPLRAAELARATPPAALARIARDSAAGPWRRRRSGGSSYAEVLRAGLGPELYAAMYGPYAVKLWGLPGERIDPEQARRRVSADTPAKVAVRVLRGSRGDGPGRTFYYPRRGFGQIVDALADAAVAAGADLRLETPADAVESGPAGRVTVHSGVAAIEAAQVFSTLPLPVLARITTPAPSSAVLAAAGRLRFRAMLLVYVVHEGGRWTPYDAHYLPGLATPVTRLSEPANYRDSADDPSTHSVVCAEIPCDEGDALWQANDDVLAALVREACARHGLPLLPAAAAAVRRMPHVYPVYETGYADHLAGLDAWASALPGVTTFGRLGLFAHDNTHHAMAMAYDAAAALGVGGAWDAAAWSAARDRFAGHVVED